MSNTPVIDIGKGEPDFDTPDFIKQAAHDAIDANFTKYTPQPGIDALREAVAAKFQRDNGVAVSPAAVVVSCGGKHSVEQSIRAVVGSGDEVIIPTPHWFAYPAQVRLVGGTPVLVPCASATGYALDIDAIRDAITPKTRLVIINTPCNPTGAVYSRAVLEEIARLAVERDLLVLCDEVYECLVYDGARHVSLASLGEEIAARTITVNSVSKTHAMTGFRIGYAALPGGLAERVVNIQKNSTSAPCAISQRAALAALTGDASHVRAMVSAYARRRATMLRLLESIPGLTTSIPQGTFYCFVNIEAFFGREIGGIRLTSADDVAAALLRTAGVSVVSATPFGSDRHIRLSFAVSEPAVAEGTTRMKSLLTIGDPPVVPRS